MENELVRNVENVIPKNKLVKCNYYTTKKVQIKTEKNYKYVSCFETEWGLVARVNMPRYNWQKYFQTEREAAIAVDKKLIENGREPVNILIKKSKLF